MLEGRGIPYSCKKECFFLFIFSFVCFSLEANDGSHAMVRLLILRRNSGKVSDYSLCPHSRNNADNDEDDDDDCDK